MKVLVAIDQKPSSQAIVDALIKMHWFEGTEIHIMTVREKTAAAAPDAEAVACEIEELAVALHDALTYCQVSYLPVVGEPKEAIIETAAQIEADMIVLGSNCKNTLERLLIGSVSQAVLNSAHCPVIIAKTPCCLAREASPGFRNILIPIDNSIFSDIAVRWLANLQWRAECRFIVAAAVEENTDMRQVEQSIHQRGAYLSQILKTNNVVVEAVVGAPKQAILDLAHKYYADLIVMGSHGRTGLQKLILGNIAQGVSHDAPCAVAIVRGIAPDDHQWIDSGAFDKVEPVRIESLMGGYSGGPGGGFDLGSPNVPPGGM